MKPEELKIIASRLAKHFDSGQGFGPCACIGLGCSHPDCEIWWEEFLTLFKIHDIARMVEAYIVITGYPQRIKQSEHD